MKISETTKYNLKTIGFGVNDTVLAELYYQSWAVSVSILGIASQFVFVLCAVNTVEEYMQCTFMITAGTAMAISYFSVIDKKTEFNELIDHLQAIIDESK